MESEIWFVVISHLGVGRWKNMKKIVLVAMEILMVEIEIDCVYITIERIVDDLAFFGSCWFLKFYLVIFLF